MKRRELVRAPMRDVVGIAGGGVPRGGQFKWVIELSCGHKVGRKLLRDTGRAGCEACQLGQPRPRSDA